MTSTQDFKITWEWDPAAPARAPEHRATWASISIQAGYDFVTLVEDRASGSSRRSIFCPLYPLAEWAAYNWWFLQAEARPTTYLSHAMPSAMRNRHSLAASGDGFAWPDLMLIPDSGETQLVWGNSPHRTPNLPVRFLSQGHCWVPSPRILEELELLISSTLNRLAEQGVTGTALEREWAGIAQSTSEVADYCRAAARLGLDPYSTAEPFEQDILLAADALGADELADVFNVIMPESIGAALAWISSGRALMNTAGAPGSRSGEDESWLQTVSDLRASRSSFFAGQPAPWTVGYEQARAFRARVEPDSTKRLEMGRFVASQVSRAPDRSLLALGTVDEQAPSVVIGQPYKTDSGKRFTLARALWHHIWDDSRSFIVTTGHTYRQQVERAFAAQLLAPAEGIDALLEGSPETASDEELEQVAKDFDVSPFVVEHQVRNRLIAA